MTKKVIAIDLDEVLAETIDQLLKYYNYSFKWKSITKEDVIDYNLWKLDRYGISISDAKRMFFWFLFFSRKGWRIKPVKFSRAGIKKLKEKWYELYIVTARPSLTIFKRRTKHWVNKYFKWVFKWIKYSDYMMRNQKKKSDICKQIGAEIIIEDNLDNAVECAKNWIKAYLIDKPWNQWFDPKIHKGVTKVNSWKEIVL